MTTTLVLAAKCRCELPAPRACNHGMVLRCDACGTHWRLSRNGGLRTWYLAWRSPAWLRMNRLGVWRLRRRIARKDGKK